MRGKMNGPGIHLLPVRDRGVIYHPPTRHRGQPLKQGTICGAIAAADYFAEMLLEAEVLEEHE